VQKGKGKMVRMNVFQPFFDDFFTDLGDSRLQPKSYPCDVVKILGADKEPESIVISYALAGIKPEEVKVKVVDSLLVIEINPEPYAESEDKVFIQRGLSRRKARLEWKLGTTLNRKAITKKFENGLLSITIPMLEKETFEI